MSTPETPYAAATTYVSEAGPRPPLARMASILYAAFAVIMLGCGVVARVRWCRPGYPLELLFPTWMVLYGVGLSFGADRLQSANVNHHASPWICAPLLVHAACLLLGAGVFLRPFSPSLLECGALAQGAAAVGFLAGWIPTFVPYDFARRGGALWITAFAGPVVLVLLSALQPAVYR